MAAHSKKAFITGIGGFTGQHLTNHLLNKGWDVCGTGTGDNADERISYLKTDINDIDAFTDFFKQEAPGYIFHLAGISFVQHPVVSDFYNVNVIGTEQLIKAALKSGIDVQKLILASSATVYGNQLNNYLDETMLPCPTNHYGISKLAMEYVACTYFDQLPIIITRPFNYSGTAQSRNFVIPKIVSHFAEKKQSIDLGNIDTLREFNDIRFVADVYEQLALSNSRSEITNICSGKSHSIREIITLLEDITGHKIAVNVQQHLIRENEIQELKGNPNKLNSLIGSFNNNNDLKNLLTTVYQSYL